MAVLPLLRYPDPRLREISSPVTVFDDSLRQLAADLGDTMRAARGAGLSAVQVGHPVRLFVIAPWIAGGPPDGKTVVVVVNPEVDVVRGEFDDPERSPEQVLDDEGCLSFPGVFVLIRRAARVRVRAQDVSGKPFELSDDGLLARAIQHEVDHLEGRLLIDRVGPVVRKIIEKKTIKLAKIEKAARDNEGRRRQR